MKRYSKRKTRCCSEYNHDVPPRKRHLLKTAGIQDEGDRALQPFTEEIGHISSITSRRCVKPNAEPFQLPVVLHS